MPVIIVCSSSGKSILSNSIIKALCNYGEVLQIDNRSLICNKISDNYDFIVINSESVLETLNTKGIIIFDENFQSNTEIKLERFISIFDSSNKEVIKMLNGVSNKAVACGTSSKDTFSISSISRDSATISLQREITDINGDKHEPHEFKVVYNEEIEAYTLLCICATLLVSGILSDNGYII